MFSPSDTDPPPAVPSVDEEHPEVKKAMEAAEAKVRDLQVHVTQDMFLEALRAGVQMAEQQRKSLLSDERMYVSAPYYASVYIPIHVPVPTLYKYMQAWRVDS